MFRSIKNEWRELRKGRRGHRFQERWERKQKSHASQSGGRGFLEPAIGLLLLAAGIVFCFIPGPGLPLILVGAALLAERSLAMARALDWLEVRVRKVIGWAKARWRKASAVAKNALAFAAAVGIGAAGYGAYQLVFH